MDSLKQITALPIPASKDNVQTRQAYSQRAKYCWVFAFLLVSVALSVEFYTSELPNETGHLKLDVLKNITRLPKSTTISPVLSETELKSSGYSERNFPSSFPCCKRRPYCLDKCWFGNSPIQLSEEQYKANTRTQSCCRTNDGGVPLDITLKDRIFSKKPFGFFIEAGGQDGVFQSNTLVAEKLYGWRGLLIEPSKSLIPWCTKIRTASKCIHAALVGKNGPQYVTIKGESPTGKIEKIDENKGSDKVHSFPLSTLLNTLQIKSIDLFSLDVEGNEYDALMGIDFNIHRPMYILIEVWDMNQKIFDKMQMEGYTLTDGIRNGLDDVSGWRHHTRHRDFLWKDERLNL